ncbi:YciI family protein [Phenylobacterium sp.]|uniref:YciI family protein n=1 Tax=Phenylobacterium sp. TaxID=1871053 RepID=UPI002C5DD271|nr:YciI family protein [Phenylobacterium sp.]HLZ76834.1 YciI family protein [Phenylobacterium sp.]
MRFMFIIKTDGQQTAGPPPAMMEAMHAMAQREVAAGRMISDGGLFPRDAGAEVSIRKRKLAVTDGPFAETKEVIGGFAVFELPDMAAAIQSARDFMELHVEHMPGWEGVCEVRQIAGSQVQMLRGG